MEAQEKKAEPNFVLIDIPQARDSHARNIPEPGDAERAAAARYCGYVQVALQRVEAMRATPDVEFAEPSPSELAEACGKNVRRCELRTRNWRNKVFVVEFEDGTLAIAKQLVMGNEAMLRRQYDHLRHLAELNIPGLRVPKQLGLFPAKRVLLMDFAPGKSLEALTWRSPDVLVACQLAGKILAGIHLAQTDKLGAMPAKLIARDLAVARWRLSSRDKKLLNHALDKLAKTNVRLGEVYYDYKPANLLFHNKELFLVDPPDTLWRGVLLWDFACFRSSMRRHIWRMILRTPFATRQRRLVQNAIEGFEDSYRASFGECGQDCAFSRLAIRVLELQRNAVLITNQQAKVRLIREELPIARGKRFGNPLANRISLPLLEFERRWLFRQLARELTSA
jgi:Phosphotransferase enzyme family